MKSTTQLLRNIKSSRDLNSILQEIPDLNFIDYLNELLNKYDSTVSKIASRTNLDRTYTYQIFEGKRNPSKDKVILIGIGLKASLEEINRLLSLSDNGTLYAKVKRDSVIIYGLSHHLNVFEINELLQEYELSILK